MKILGLLFFLKDYILKDYILIVKGILHNEDKSVLGGATIIEARVPAVDVVIEEEEEYYAKEKNR